MGRTFFFEAIKKDANAVNNGDKDYTMSEIKDKSFFEELTFSREVIKHHLPHVYEQALLSEKVRYMKE